MLNVDFELPLVAILACFKASDREKIISRLASAASKNPDFGQVTIPGYRSAVLERKGFSGVWAIYGSKRSVHAFLKKVGLDRSGAQLPNWKPPSEVYDLKLDVPQAA